MKALALVIITVVLTRSHCRKSTFFLRESGIQLAMLPDQSQVKLDCGPVAVAVFGNQANLTSIEWSKDSIQIAGNYTDRRVLIFNDNRELLIDGLTKAIGLDGNGTEGNYTCKVCLNQRCNESTMEVVTDPDGTSLTLTRCVSIGAHAVVWLLEQVPVLLDCEEKAIATFGPDLSLTSVKWFRNTIEIEDDCTVRNISPNNLQLQISVLSIRTGAEDGTEATFTCRVCKNEECQIFHTELIAYSPPILGCGVPSLVSVSTSGLVNLVFGCDLCVQPNQSIPLTNLNCTPDTRRQPTSCTIHNPDGQTAKELADGLNFIRAYFGMTIIGKIRNPEDPAPPTVLGDWTCTCVNENGVSTATSRIGECSVGLSFDSSQYSVVEDHYRNTTVTIGLTANSTTGFTYIVEISVKDINTTAGLDYNVTSLNVTMRAGERRAMFSMGIIADFILERRESFQCTVSKIHHRQAIPIEWDQDPATVIIDDLIFTTIILGNYSSVVSENVSHVPITIETFDIAEFEYTVDLYVDIGSTAKEGSDFVLPEVVFRPYQRSVTVNVLIIDDEIGEEVEDFTIYGNIVAPDHGSVKVSGSVTIEIIDDDSCTEYFIFPRTNVDEVATVPCSTDGSGSGMYGNIESKCEKGGVWGRVDMSQCTFRRDVPGHPILWMVELGSTNLTSLQRSISELGQAQNVIVKKQEEPNNSDRSVYFIQAPNDDIVKSTRIVISSKLIRESIVMRRNGCNCCENAKIDLFNSKSTYTEICEGEDNIQVPCSCLNGENKCAAFYLDEDSKCYLDTDQDNKPDVNDPCIECCPEEFNIFLWPKRDYGVTVEANCSEIHPSFGGSKVSRTCGQNDTWDPVDISSCTFKKTTQSTPIILFNATVNGSDINEAREILKEQARNLVPGNTSFVNVTVTEVATDETTNNNQIVVIFVIEFSKNTTLVENFTTAISEPSISLKYVQGVIPAVSCSCSSNRSDKLRRLCIGTATAPCDCDQGANCECVDPYFSEPGDTCTLDTDGDKIADYKDLCPYEYGENCPKPPPVSKCPQETDSTWKLFWRDTERGDTLYTRCPGGVNVSAGLANRMCRADGTWGDVDTRNCISRAFLDIEQRTQDVKQVLKMDNALTNKQREVITGITRDLSAALNVNNTLSVLPGDLTMTTNFVEELASLSDNNGLFSGQNNTEQQMAVVGVISGVLDNRNVHAFRATSKSAEQETPAESLLKSMELLTRTGFVQQDQSLPPPDALLNKSENVVVGSNLVVQSNRLNSLSFTSPSFKVSFPSREFNDFARAALIPTIVIPGGFLNALIDGSDGGGTQTPVPAESTMTLLTPSAVSPTASQTPPMPPPTPTVPTTDTNNKMVAKPVDVVSFTMNNLQKLLPLRLSNELEGSDGTRRIEPVSLIVSSQVAGVENTTVDSGETISISFTLLENAQDIIVDPHEKKIHCAFWDFAGRNGYGEWSFDGIKKVFDNGTHVQCDSKHLTTFVVLASSVSTKTSTPSPPDGDVNSTNVGAIIAGSLAVLLVVITSSLILGIVLLKCWRKKKNKDAVFRMRRNQPSRAAYNLTEVVIHPGESTTLGDWEMTHSDLELQGDLGKGQFGDVKLAYLKTITCTWRVRNYMDRMIKLGNSMSTLNAVAVKYLKGTATCESKAIFLEEIELMKKVSTNSNNHIVQLIGYILLEQPMAMVMEYVPFGDLHSNLIKWKEQIGESSMSSVQSNSDNTAGQNYLYSKETLKDQDIFSFAYQIAIGMKYLASMNVIHRDLACRNVLVGENKMLKISDFGLSKEIDGVYASSSRTRLPVRWMAPEAITHRLFSEKSDIWSYGVCLWEICTLGEVPYGHLPNAEVARSIVKSILLERPPACNDKIHELMLRCWRKKASDRPTFTDIKTYLEGLIEKECGSMYIMLEKDYEGENEDFTGEEMPQDVESI